MQEDITAAAVSAIMSPSCLSELLTWKVSRAGLAKVSTQFKGARKGQMRRIHIRPNADALDGGGSGAASTVLAVRNFIAGRDAERC